MMKKSIKKFLAFTSRAQPDTSSDASIENGDSVKESPGFSPQNSRTNLLDSSVHYMSNRQRINLTWSEEKTKQQTVKNQAKTIQGMDLCSSRSSTSLPETSDDKPISNTAIPKSAPSRIPRRSSMKKGPAPQPPTELLRSKKSDTDTAAVHIPNRKNEETDAPLIDFFDETEENKNIHSKDQPKSPLVIQDLNNKVDSLTENLQQTLTINSDDSIPHLNKLGQNQAAGLLQHANLESQEQYSTSSSSTTGTPSLEDILKPGSDASIIEENKIISTPSSIINTSFNEDGGNRLCDDVVRNRSDESNIETEAQLSSPEISEISMVARVDSEERVQAEANLPRYEILSQEKLIHNLVEIPDSYIHGHSDAEILLGANKSLPARIDGGGQLCSSDITNRNFHPPAQIEQLRSEKIFNKATMNKRKYAQEQLPRKRTNVDNSSQSSSIESKITSCKRHDDDIKDYTNGNTSKRNDRNYHTPSNDSRTGVAVADDKDQGQCAVAQSEKSKTDTKTGGKQFTQEQKQFVKSSKDKIAAVINEVVELEEEINSFLGTNSNDGNYIYMDEVMMRCLIKLDNVETKNDEQVRDYRKDGIKYIQTMMKQLDNKLQENQKKLTRKEEAAVDEGSDEDSQANEQSSEDSLSSVKKQN